ncbi:head completion/stabilization protein [Plesiomonas sp.]|uniref:head completion/stabilization protein n=1 Tax=Plesiomonas sp. TaxID=2486279 RepID=UPI003EE6408E
MDFVAPEQPDDNAGVITNTPFWPDVDLEHYRQAMRNDGTVTNERLKEAALSAICETNAELALYKEQQRQRGFNNLAEIPAATIGGFSELTYWYRRAVYCRTKANLTERYPDIDTTKSGSKRADDMLQAVDDLWRDAQWAVQRLQGRSHITVELI